MMKLTVILSTAVLSLAALLPTSAIAQEPDYVCYWRQSDGTVVDLSSLCQKQATTTPVSPDNAFIADFQAMASHYPDNIRQALNIYANEYRDFATRLAKVNCQALKFGNRRTELKPRQGLAADNASSMAEALRQIIPSLAIKHYCPELATR